MKRHILWAIPKGQPEYRERLICDTSERANLLTAREWATANGYDRFRVSQYDTNDTTTPDFGATVNI